MKYLTTKEIADIWNISERSVRNYCSNGRIIGAILVGKTWNIPSDAVKPTRNKRSSKKEKSLLEILKEEKSIKLKGRIYHKLQVEMTYNSNHIEGSKLNLDQTSFIFETNTIGATNTATNIDDIIETINHFRCIDFVIDHAESKLSESFIKKLHLLLKQNTSSSQLDWFKVVEYKVHENEVGGNKTTSVNDVKKEMQSLLNDYNNIIDIDIRNIVDFHFRFESIHPFQDGNGRVGRLIMLKECLKYNIVPIIIKDEFKQFYYHGLQEYKYEQGYLLDTCLHGQDIFKDYLDYFKIKY